MKPREINVHIEELVLHGFNPGTRWEVADALRDELRTLLLTQGIPSAWQANPAVLSTGGAQIAPHSKPAVTGAQIARAVHQEGAP